MIALKLDRSIVLPGDEVSGVCCVRGCEDSVLPASTASLFLDVQVRGVHVHLSKSSLILSSSVSRSHLHPVTATTCAYRDRTARLAYRFTCRLPLSLAPTHRGVHHRVEYTVVVEVSTQDHQVLARALEPLVVAQAPTELDCDSGAAYWSILCAAPHCDLPRLIEGVPLLVAKSSHAFVALPLNASVVEHSLASLVIWDRISQDASTRRPSECVSPVSATMRTPPLPISPTTPVHSPPPATPSRSFLLSIMSGFSSLFYSNHVAVSSVEQQQLQVSPLHAQTHLPVSSALRAVDAKPTPVVSDLTLSYLDRLMQPVFGGHAHAVSHAVARQAGQRANAAIKSTHALPPPPMPAPPLTQLLPTLVDSVDPAQRQSFFEPSVARASRSIARHSRWLLPPSERVGACRNEIAQWIRAHDRHLSAIIHESPSLPPIVFRLAIDAADCTSGALKESATTFERAGTGDDHLLSIVLCRPSSSVFCLGDELRGYVDLRGSRALVVRIAISLEVVEKSHLEATASVRSPTDSLFRNGGGTAVTVASAHVYCAHSAALPFTFALPALGGGGGSGGAAFESDAVSRSWRLRFKFVIASISCNLTEYCTFRNVPPPVLAASVSAASDRVLVDWNALPTARVLEWQLPLPVHTDVRELRELHTVQRCATAFTIH